MSALLAGLVGFWLGRVTGRGICAGDDCDERSLRTSIGAAAYDDIERRARMPVTRCACGIGQRGNADDLAETGWRDRDGVLACPYCAQAGMGLGQPNPLLNTRGA